TEVFGCPAARDDKTIVVGGLQFAERGVQREVMPRLFAVGLITLEVMYSGPHFVARLLIRTNSVDGVADHLQSLERHHGFVVLDVIADKHQNLLRRHFFLLSYAGHYSAWRAGVLATGAR